MAVEEPYKGSIYKRNEAAFFDVQSEENPSSKGSIFQRNAARFYGYKTPARGKRPFIIPPSTTKTSPPSVQRNVFKGNDKDLNNFFGVEEKSVVKKMSYAEKLNAFIGH